MRLVFDGLQVLQAHNVHYVHVLACAALEALQISVCGVSTDGCIAMICTRVIRIAPWWAFTYKGVVNSEV